MKKDQQNTTQTKTSQLHQHPDFIESVNHAHFLGVLTDEEREKLLTDCTAQL